MAMNGRRRPALSCLGLLVAACGCYQSYAVLADANPDREDRRGDAPDDGSDLEADAPIEAEADVREDGGCPPVDDRCAEREVCGDGDDDDCDGEADEDCPCAPGSVRPCFAGPPGRRNVGACTDGEQICLMSGAWGACEGGIVPQDDVCNGLDNRCDGCSQMADCELDCPGPGDPRVPDGAPMTDYPLDGRLFYPGLVRTWHWDVQGGPCDLLAARFSSYVLLGPDDESATLQPLLSGDYTVTLTIVTTAGTTLVCRWIVHVRGPGLRVEMCYPESEYEDLDLFVKQPGATTPWYPHAGEVHDPSRDQCGWHNCEARIRVTGGRADWGYAPSDLAECVGGPLGEQWRTLGYCANPRLDVDNNLSEGIGLPENINIDVPRDGETFRIMVENFTGGDANPVINVYCGGRRAATFGAPPDELPDFSGRSHGDGVGAMWRVADVTTRVAADGSVACEVLGLHPPGASEGYDLTENDVRY
ncbi:MAG: hypothetical protein HY905_12075 [Deltaproteobacteria bacterium]|nr:hypothetical protein [Deltaproteobacteria bacterium]